MGLMTMQTVKLAPEATLGRVGNLLEALRRETVLAETAHGIFHHRGRAFLHFHQDPAGIFADLKIAETWVRLAANTKFEQQHLLKRVRDALFKAQ